MKGFKFKLQSVLEAREKKFLDAQLEFAKVKNRLFSEKSALDSMYKDYGETSTGLENVLKSGLMDYTLILCHQNYMLKLKEDIAGQHTLIGQIEKALEEKNRIMLAAMKDKTMMEKLREKALEEFRKNEEKRDLINIDEIAVNRYKRAG